MDDHASRARRVLVVDDMPEILDYFTALARRMKTLAMTVETEPSAARALERVREEPFDLVVSDYRMDGIDGVDVLAAARERHPEGHRILMTGYNEIPTSVARVRAADVDAYVQKPLNAQDLMVLLMDFVQENADAIDACRAQARDIERLGLADDRLLMDLDG